MARNESQSNASIPNPIRVILEKNSKTKINWGQVWSIFIPALFSIITLYISNYISADTQRKNKLRDEMILYSIQTYNDLNEAIALSHKGDSTAYTSLDRAFSRIQLFGDDEQVIGD